MSGAFVRMLAATAFIANPALALQDGAPAAWVVEEETSTLGFTASQTGQSFEGRFGSFAAEIILDPADLENASIDVTIDTASAKTGDRQRDGALPGSDWFKTKEFPSASFVSDNISQTSAGGYVAKGVLTIRDTAKDVELPFTLAIDGDRAHAVGELTLVRTDFGVGQGEFSTGEWVGLEVVVKVDITATKP